MKDQKTQAGLQPYLSPAAAWALAVGTSVGWGSLVVTANTYLAQAGPFGSILSLLVGMALMLVISRNFFLHGKPLSPCRRHLCLNAGGLWL